jgi:hypothetical protein
MEKVLPTFSAEAERQALIDRRNSGGKNKARE